MLGNWAGRGMQVLAPVIDRMIEHLKASDGLFMDETTVPVMAPGTGKTRLDYLWAIARDQRGYGGVDPPIVVFHHSRHRSAKVALELMRGYTGGGPLHVDGYRVYDALGDPKQTVSPWVLAYCWTYVACNIPGHTVGAGSAKSTTAAARRSQPKACAGSPSSTPSRPRSAAVRPSGVSPNARHAARPHLAQIPPRREARLYRPPLERS